VLEHTIIKDKESWRETETTKAPLKELNNLDRK